MGKVELNQEGNQLIRTVISISLSILSFESLSKLSFEYHYLNSDGTWPKALINHSISQRIGSYSVPEDL